MWTSSTEKEKPIWTPLFNLLKCLLKWRNYITFPFNTALMTLAKHLKFSYMYYIIIFEPQQLKKEEI